MMRTCALFAFFSSAVGQTVIARYDSSDHVVNYDVKGNTAYLADASGGLLVIDIGGVPASPVLSLLGSYTASHTMDVLVEGTVAYTIGEDCVLSKIDVATPASPSLIGVSAFDAAYSGGVSLAKIPGSNFVFGCVGKAVRVFDVSGAVPIVSSTESLPVFCLQIRAQAMRLHVLAQDKNYRVYNIGPSSALTLHGTVNYGAVGVGFDISQAADAAFISTDDKHLYQLDISDADPTKWSFNTRDSSNQNKGVLRVNELLFTTSTASEMFAYEMNLNAKYGLMSTINIGGSGEQGIGVRGTWLFACYGSHGFVILDAANLMFGISFTDVPATPSPVPPTTAPATSAPATSSPDTPTPATSAPATSSPVTNSPITPVPATNPPATLAPATLAPSTNAPITPAPSTQAPATSSPMTLAPATTPPATLAPATNSPVTLAPATQAPATSSPITPAPATNPPATLAPATLAPATQAPATNSPITLAPATSPPATLAPNSPVTPAPATSAPVTAPTNPPITLAPVTQAPVTSSPLTPAPATNPPDTLTPATSAPATSFPVTLSATQAPVTGSPDTLAPATQVHVTTAPLTPTTATGSPDTLAPATSAPPLTNPPSTSDVPRTLVPVSTLIPATNAPEVLSNEQEISTAGSAAAAGSVAEAGAAAGTATRLVVVSLGCNMNGKRQKLPRVLHPTQLEIWGSESVGLVVGNFAITFGFGLLCYVLVRIAMCGGAKMFPRLFNGLDTQGWMRFPSAPLVVFQLFYQGTTLGSINLIIHPPNPAGFALGAVSMFVCITVPIVVFSAVKRSVPRLAVYMHEQRCGEVRRFMIGPGEWVNTTKMCYWVQRFTSVVRTYRQHTAWYSLIEFAASLTISAIAAVETETFHGCGHKRVFTAGVFFLMMALEATVWPHARFRDSTMDFVILGVQGIAMVLMSVGYYKNDLEHKGFQVASSLLLAAVILLLVKVGLDIVSELYILFTGRKARLQNELLARDNDRLDEVELCRQEEVSSINRLSSPARFENYSQHL